MSVFFPIAMGLLLLSWLQPMHIPPWLSWHSEQLAFLSMFLLAAGALHASGNNGSKRVLVPRVVLLPVVLIGIIGIQCITHFIDYYGDGLVGAFYLGMFSISIVAASSLCAINKNEPKASTNATQYLDWLAVTFIIGIICSLFIALCQALLVWQDVSWIHRTSAYRRPGANMGQANHLATLAVLGLGSIFYLLRRKILTVTSASLLAFLSLQIIAISESRTGMISAVLILVWWHTKSHVQTRQEKMKGQLGLMVLVALVWAWPRILAAIHSGGFADSGEAQTINTSGGARFVVWPELWDAILQKPWLGWGWFSIAKAHNSVLDGYAEGYPFTYAHNIFLDLGISIGLPAALLVALLVSIWFVRRAQAWKGLNHWYAVAITIPMLVHSLLEYPHAYAYFLLPMAFAVGTIESQGAGKKHFSIDRRYFASMLIIVFAFWVVSVVDYFAMEENYRVSRFVSQKVGKLPDGYVPNDAIFLNQLEALSQTLNEKVRPDLSEAKIEYLRKSSMRFPFYATQNRYALALALSGQTVEAERQLRVMKIMHGDKAFEGIRETWESLAQSDYPQLKAILMP